jgi:oligosaccharide 4-alpha-D-glucosyltransferase
MSSKAKNLQSMPALLRSLFFAILFIGLSPFSSVSQSSQIDQFHSQDGQFHFETPAGLYLLQFYSPEILEVSFYPDADKHRESTPSYAVVLSEPFTGAEVVESESLIKLQTTGIVVKAERTTGKFSFFYHDQKLLEENRGFEVDDEGFNIDFSISETEILMGGGARALGMDRRGNRLRLYNRAHYGYETRSELMNYTLPMVLSSNMYAIHFDNPTTGYLDLDSQNNNTLTFEALSGRKSYQLIAGNRWEDIIGNYVWMTGYQPLPPLWTFGNFSSRFGYRSQNEVLATAKKFRDLDVPVDAIILDLFWFGKTIQDTMGNLAFDRDSFPEPQQMIEQLEEKGVKTVLITEPFILTTSDRWDEAVEHRVLATDTLGNPATYDFFFGNTGLIDIVKPQARDWFWNIYDGLKQYGVHGWWGDLGEPEVHPEYLQHHTGTANEIHNIYGHEWARLLHDGYTENYPNKRLFNLMRAGYSGSQRYGMIPWTGDVARSWGGLQPQPEISLQMGLQGLAYMHSDLGGFAGNLVDDELYVRWMQYGVFQPVYRPHAQEEVPSEPVFRSQEALDLSRKAIELRYRLLPYIYTAAYQNSTTGLPFMRPLFFEEPENHEIYKVSGTYLFGDDILVAPVMHPGIDQQRVWFPKRSNWYDFYTGQKYSGGKQEYVPTRTESIPTFVRGGAIIPMTELVQTTDHYSAEEIHLKLFFDEEVPYYSTFIYHDDGLTANSYRHGQYEKLHVRSINREGESIIRLMKESGRHAEPEFDRVSLEVVNYPSEPGRITLDETDIEFTWEDGVLIIPNIQLTESRRELIIVRQE